MKRSTILYLIASGIVAYLYGFPTNGLSHFDEGQYAFARVWPWIDKFDVDQAFFSPPLFPFLVGLVQHLPITRPDLAGVYISHIACWMSLFFAVRLAVAWWGEDAALPTFALLLLSPMRLAFGSIGLTDALFSALFLATLLAATKAFHDGSTKWTLLAGLLAGLTWSCKYNGFITVAVCAGFFLHQRTFGSFVRWLTIAIIAVAIMAPWYWAIHTHHPEGIAALQKHQQGYLRGFAPESIWSNLQQGFSLRSEVPGPSVFIASWVMLGIAAFAKREWLSLVTIAGLLVAEECCSSKLLPLVALAALPLSLWAARPSARPPALLAIVGTVVLPAIYTPYLRLWLPGEHLMIVMLGAFVGATGRFNPSVGCQRTVVVIAACLLLAPSFLRVSGQLQGLLGWRMPESIWKLHVVVRYARRPMPHVEGYLTASQELADFSNTHEIGELLLYARPPLLYYLAHSKLHAAVKRLPDEHIALERLRSPTTIVADVAVRDSKHIATTLREGRRIRVVQRSTGWPVSAHPLTVLDDFGTNDWANGREYKVNLYLVAPFSEPPP